MNSYFLADAYNQRYDTIPAISKKVNYAAITMLGQYKGYLWNKVEEPKLVFTEREVKNTYKRQNKIFDVEYLLFPSKTIFREILHNDTIIKTEFDFKKLVNKCHNTPVEYINAQLLYPFSVLEPVKKQIYKLKQGSISAISFTDGRPLIIHVKKLIEKNNGNSGKKKGIYESLKRIKEKQIVDSKQQLIFNKAHIVINNEVANMVLSNPSLEEPPETLLTKTVLEYKLNKQPNILLVAGFLTTIATTLLCT